MFRKDFNEDDYLEANPDVAVAVNKGIFCSGQAHYLKYGKNEGRRLKGLAGKTSREEKVFSLLNKNGLGLEIGPSHNPIAPKKKGYNVHILDHAHTFEAARINYIHSVSHDDYIDVHCWKFTPASFRLLISDLLGLDLIGLEIKAEFVTNGCEFYVSLGKKTDMTKNLERLEALKKGKLENV